MQHTTDKEEREKYERHQKASARKEHVSGGAGDEAQRILSRPSPSGKTGDANPRADKLPLLAQALGCSIDALFQDDLEQVRGGLKKRAAGGLSRKGYTVRKGPFFPGKTEGAAAPCAGRQATPCAGRFQKSGLSPLPCRGFCPPRPAQGRTAGARKKRAFAAEGLQNRHTGRGGSPPGTPFAGCG